MTASMIILLIIIFIALVLFTVDIFPAEIVALAIMLSLILTGILPTSQAFEGFGSDTSLMILGVLLLTTALVKTGVVHLLSGRILSRVGKDENRLFWMINLVVSGLSAFISNTATAAFFVPVTIGISRRLHVNASKLLMPLAFAAILSSSVTLVATSTNIVVSGILTDHGLKGIGMFELTPVGIPILVVGLLYMYFIGRHLIPLRSSDSNEEMRQGLLAYCTEVSIPNKSAWVGKTLENLKLGQLYDLTVLRIIKKGAPNIIPRGQTVVSPGDKLLLEGSRDGILTLANQSFVEFTGNPEEDQAEKISQDLKLAEVILMPGSRLIGRTLKGLNFRQRFGLQVLGISRKGKTIRRRIASTALQVGDQLLLQGDPDTIASLGSDDSFRIISSKVEAPVDTKKAPLAIGIFVGVMLLVAFNILSLPVAVLLGTLLVFVTGCVTPQQAYHSASWNAWLLISSMLALGKAMEETGLATVIANQLVTRLGAFNPLFLLGAFFIVAMLLTQPMSNQAAAVVTIPIAIQTALLLGLNPRTFAIMIAVGAATSYITPLEPACLMVYGPGNYRFMDFIKVGSILTLLIFSLVMLLVPIFWPL